MLSDNTIYVKSLYEIFPLATYSFVEEEGPPHQKTFVFCVEVKGQEYTGIGKSKKAAKQMAAATALKAMGILPDDPLVTSSSNGDRTQGHGAILLGKVLAHSVG